MKRVLYFIMSGMVLFGCQESIDHPAEVQDVLHQTPEDFLIKTVGEAHAKAEFRKNEAVKFDIVLNFGGKERMNGTITLLTNSTKGRIELKDGSIIIYDNGKVFHSPGIENEDKVRFNAYTWSYFFLFPFKLEDKGAKWSDFTTGDLRDTMYNKQKLTFASGTGDAPDDWYVMYSDVETNLVKAASYIVTLNKSREEAEKDPHAIEYNNYKKVDGVPFATEWTFWGWTPTDGLTNELGNATISRIEFVSNTDELFKIPANYVEK